jgi:cobalt-zinc-cadmium efflux system protein
VSHDHAVRLDSDRRLLGAALALIAFFLVVEVVAAVVSGSLALLADAGHMLADVGALGLALGAATMARRPAGGRWTFGFRRLEILAAQVNGIVLAVIGVLIVYSAVRRLADPSEVRGGIVLVVALAGVAVSFAASVLLARAGRESLNVRGAFLHVVTDLAAFAGTAVAGGLILVTGWDRFDPIASLAVAALVLWSAYVLLREATGILLEISPADIDPEAVGKALAEEPQVAEVHDLHLWTVTSGFPAFSAHVLVEGGADCHAIRLRLERLLADRFGLDHTTLQVDHAASPERLVKLRRRV